MLELIFAIGLTFSVAFILGSIMGYFICEREIKTGIQEDRVYQINRYIKVVGKLEVINKK